MLDPASWITGGSVAAASFLTVLMLLARGQLVGGRMHHDRIADHKEQIEALRDDRAYWRDVALESMNALGAAVGRSSDG